MKTSASAEWYTPPVWAERIAGFMGRIDLDPCARGSQAVPALRHETVDGLAIVWRGKVYANPEYGRKIGLWVEKGLNDPVDEIVMLLPARTDTAWFQPLWNSCTLCFIRGRLKFSGSANSAPFPSVLAYRGNRHAEFVEAFWQYGTCAQRQWFDLSA